MIDYAEGDRVSHAMMGEGTVIAMDGSGPDCTVTVEFDTRGVKKMKASLIILALILHLRVNVLIILRILGHKKKSENYGGNIYEKNISFGYKYCFGICKGTS